MSVIAVIFAGILTETPVIFQWSNFRINRSKMKTATITFWFPQVQIKIITSYLLPALINTLHCTDWKQGFLTWLVQILSSTCNMHFASVDESAHNMMDVKWMPDSSKGHVTNTLKRRGFCDKVGRLSIFLCWRHYLAVSKLFVPRTCCAYFT